MKNQRPHARADQRGFGVIAAIFVLVILAALAAAIVRFGVGAQTTSAQAVLAARASQAARAGTEWGLYQALKGSWTACSSASQTLDLVTEQGFRVTVSCDSRSFNEGQLASGAARAVRIFTIDAVACNLGSTCPDNSQATTPGYVERRRQVQAASCSPQPTSTSEGPLCD